VVTRSPGLRIRDVRDQMPSRGDAETFARRGAVTGIAVHHSATANRVTGVSMDDASTIFRHHVEHMEWSRGGYHYLIHANGLVEYALDESASAPHAGFSDAEDRLGLERGQYWNEHFLSLCLLGWFEADRSTPAGPIPNRFTKPAPAQWRALFALLGELTERYGLEPSTVRGHRELEGCSTRCPGANVDLAALRAGLGEGHA
jgi:N-acetyl-anhydromuramyl-L-alanine amidase AmpD